MKLIGLLVVCCALACGCATPATDTFEYNENSPISVGNEIGIQDEFEDVWSRLVRQIAKGFFVVNNIEKESRLINVSFATTSPEEYIDCGTTRRTFKQGSIEETLEYEVAAASSYKYGAGMDISGVNAIVGYVDRDTSLEGRINIYVAPVGQQTEVTVNTRDVLTITTSGQQTLEDVYGRIVQSQSIPRDSQSISFNTNQPNRSAEGIACFSKGILERDILAMAKE